MKGGENIKILDFFKDIFGKKEVVYLNEKSNSIILAKLRIQEFAIMTAIGLIANSISKCEIKTYLKKEEVKDQEYYLWNYEPNLNQNSSQFMQELILKLLFNNECLVIDVSGQLIIADSFYQNEFVTLENNFTDVTKGDMTFNRKFRMSEVLYFKLNNRNIQILLSNLIDDYINLSNKAIEKYELAGGRKGILGIDSTAIGDPKFQERFDDLMNNKFKKYFEARNAVLPLHKGFNYAEQNGDGNRKSTNEIQDITSITKEIFERTGQAFKIPPALMKGDIADVDKITENLLTFAIDPIVKMISEEANRKRYGKKVLEGSYLKIDTTCIRHIDIFKISESFDKLIANGGYSIDELREKAGDTQLNNKWSKKHWMTKNYSNIENIEEGGEIKNSE